MGKKLFDYVIGNPPYNEDFESSGENGNYAKPVYHLFMEEVFKIADRVELIHPARFLFQAGGTPKAWNIKMLNDPHFKVLKYYPKSLILFPNIDLKGGISITYRDVESTFEPIGTFTAFEELNSIKRKSAAKCEEDSLSSIITTQIKFNLKQLYSDHPGMRNFIGSDGKDRRFRNNAFEKIALFTKSPVERDDIKVLGIINNKRVWRYIPLKYVDMKHQCPRVLEGFVACC